MAAPAVMFLAEQLKAEENDVSAAVDRLHRVGREGGMSGRRGFLAAPAAAGAGVLECRPRLPARMPN